MRSKFFNKQTGIYLLLFLFSFAFYACYYHHLLLNLNSVIFQPSGDSLKNYYTFLYHIKNDPSLFQFSGMNYPFGEHIVYTDCQPLLTFIFRLCPFAQNYAIGVMHFLMLFSFIITPLILFRIFGYFNVNRTLAFFSSLAISVLSPQLLRISGHFGMAYGCVIPIAMLLLLSYHHQPTWKKATGLLIYNCALFLIHPYLGLGGSMFCFLTIFCTSLLSGSAKLVLPALAKASLAGLAPMIVFNVFLALTDRHTDRTPEPYGIDIMDGASKMESVFTPSFGPFDHFLKQFIHSKHVEWEALSYVGFFPICLSLLAVISLPFYYRRLSFNRSLNGLFISALLLLVFAFGVHVKIFKIFDIQIPILNQFRCLGRYAWFFYFMLPVFLICTLSNLTPRTTAGQARKFLLPFVGLLFLGLNVLEGHYLLTHITKGNFEAKNIFTENNLEENQKKTLTLIRHKKLNAIVPLPMFHIGSDVYQKNGDASFLPALLYSYHTGLPVIGEVLSRTSVDETETAMALLNRYKKQRKIITLLGEDNFLLIKAGDSLREDEQRVINNLNTFTNYSNLGFYVGTTSNFKLSASEETAFVNVPRRSDTTKNIVFIPYENRQPFLSSRIDDYRTIIEIDSNSLTAGDYVASFHYHMRGKKFRYLYNHLIVVKSAANTSNWDSFNSIRSTSGFYDSMIVYEQKLHIDPHFKYKFFLRGLSKEYYRVSDFMLRPANLDVKMRKNGLVIHNNFPE